MMCIWLILCEPGDLSIHMSAAETGKDHRCPTTLAVFKSHLQKVKFKWGQVRIRQSQGRPEPELMRHYANEKAQFANMERKNLKNPFFCLTSKLIAKAPAVIGWLQMMQIDNDPPLQ